MPATDIRLLLRVASSDALRPRVRLGSAVAVECTVLDQAGTPVPGAVVTLSIVGLLTIPGLVANSAGIVTASFTPPQIGAFVAQAQCTAPLAELVQRTFDVIAADGDVTLSPPWVDAGTGALIFPPGDPVTAQRIDALPPLGAPLDEDVLPAVRSGVGGRVAWAALRDAAVDASVDASVAAAEGAAGAALGAGIARLSLSTPTALTAATHGAKWLVLTSLGNQLSLVWSATGDGFACTITNLSSYYCRPTLDGFTEALVRGVTLGIIPGGTASLFCIESGADKLAFLTGDTA